MELLYRLAELRTPVLDTFFSLITKMGEETVFLLVALVIFWCVSAAMGYYLFTVGFFGLLGNQFMKVTCRIPRPWELDPAFPIVEAAREQATGYAFPSGHTQSALCVYGCAARMTRQKWLRALCIAIIVLIGFSRLYLGVHFPKDVLFSLVFGLALVLALYPLYLRVWEKRLLLPGIIAGMTLCALLFVLYMELHRFPADMIPASYAEAVKNAYTILGASVGLLPSTLLRKKPFPVNAPWYGQLLKVALGFALILGIRYGLKPVLQLILGWHPAADAFRYAAITVFGSTIWPMTFPWFAKMGKK